MQEIQEKPGAYSLKRSHVLVNWKGREKSPNALQQNSVK